MGVSTSQNNSFTDGYSDPGAAWKHFMLAGDFELAWKISDEVLKQNAGKPQHHLPRHLQQLWQGEPLNDKRVLIRCYHGLGDTIQFIRYASLVKAIAKKVIVWVQPELLELVRNVEGVDEVLPLHNGVPEVEYDVDVEVMELAYIFRSTVETIPKHIPYIKARPRYFNKGLTSVGIVWETGNYDKRRCIPFHLLQPLNNIDGIDHYVLQANAQKFGWIKGFGIYPGDFSLAEYASIIKGLDLLITVDSMPAHLAGALGIPVWNLLHAEADWRWMNHIEYSPWYPTMRLFRQKEMGNWQEVISRVANELQLKVLKKAA